MKKGYLDKAKQFENPNTYHEGYTKSKADYYKSVSEKEHYNKEITSKQIVIDVEKEFWKHLAQLSWKWDEPNLDVKPWRIGDRQLILVCPECDLPLKSVPVKLIGVDTTIQSLVEASKTTIKKHIEQDRCKAIGKAIPKAISE